MAGDPFKYFRTEAGEIHDQLGKGVLDLERGSTPGAIAKLLRLAHTLKGAARVVKHREIADLAHSIEGALAPHRDSTVPAPKELVEAILRHVDSIGQSITGLGAPATSKASIPRQPEGEETLHAAWADAGDFHDLINGLTEAHTQLGSLRGIAADAGHARRLAGLLGDLLASSRQAGAARAEPEPVHSRIKTLSEELGAALDALRAALAPGLDQLDRELRQVRDAAERLRLVPAGVLFTSLNRAVRDAAQSLGRRAAFEGRGGEVRLEAKVLAGIRGALLQAVGNAVAHGIESEAERESAGKAPEGLVVIGVKRRGRRVVFTCQDDGRGVDLEAIRRIAEQRGVPPTKARSLGAEELLRAALKGGFSTSGAVTEVSGRGIGLDLVREAVERLSGEVNVYTEAGKGTTVELSVPLSLASIEGLIVESDGVVAAIPLDAVRSGIRIERSELARSPLGESVVYNRQVVPFMPLERAMSGGVPRAGAPRGGTAVIIEGQRGLAAIGVNRLLGISNVVVRSLPELAPAAALVAGVSLDAEGTPQIVLDPEELAGEAYRPSAPLAEPESRRLPILVIDDSLTTRMLEQSILESAGYEVDAATSAEEALEKARATRYALFLVDVEMPGMDGFRFIETARADPALRDVPAILVTSRDSAEDRLRGEQAGADGYVVKSEFEQADLLERIRALAG